MSSKIKYKKFPKFFYGRSINYNAQHIKFIISKIFPNYFIDHKYKVLKKLLPNTINDKIISISFKLRNANKIDKIPQNYMVTKKDELFELSYHFETRKCYVSSNQEEIESLDFICENDFLSLGVGIFENSIKKVINSKDNNELLINIEIINDNKTLNKFFSIPLARSRHGYFGPVNNNNFFDFQLNLKKYKGKKIKINLKGTINKGSKLAYGDDKKIIEINKKTYPFIAWSPKLFNISKKSTTKKIILLSFESMTSSFWLKDNFSKDLNLPTLTNLKNNSIHFSHALAQVDSTRPFIASMLHGLFASQHSFGDYSSKTTYKKFIPNSIISIPQILNKKSFLSSAYVPYSSFDPYFGFSNGFDSYRCAPRPEMNQVPDISWVIRSINSKLNTNQFIYNHLQFLHPPFLLNTTAQSPKSYDINSLTKAHKRDFLPLYLNQLNYVDMQLTQLIGYLKENNIYDQTMIIIMGDHGVGMPPWWKKANNDYAHYEMRSRIPLFIKKANWSKSERTWDTKKPVNATIIPFIEIIESVGCKFPENWNKVNSVESIVNDRTIIETIFHPNYDNYAISVINDGYKYWLNTKVDWDKNEIISILNQKLFKYNQNRDTFNEDTNLIDKSNEGRFAQIVKDNQEFVKSFFEKNRNFYNKEILPKI